MIHHYGPDPAVVGGMGSVIQILTEHAMGGDDALAHATCRPTAALASIPLALRASVGIPRLRRSEVVHVHLSEDGSFVREGALVALARSLGKVTVVTLHGANFVPFAERHTWIASRVLRRAHVVTCLDQEVLRLVRELAPSVHVSLVPNPVDMDDASGGADATEEIVVFAGEIGLRKGADVLARAWRQVSASRPRARCVMVGPTRDFSVPEIERLEVRGPASQQEIRALLRSARVVALPSRAEGMPMILTEAMSAGRPFVSTPVGGIAGLAREGGVLVGVEDHGALASSLIELLADAPLARRLGEKGRRYCLDTRSVDVVATHLRALYATAAERRHSET